MGLNRRDAMASLAVGALLSLTAPDDGCSQARRKTFVLVHGSWHGGWCWRRVSEAREAQGHRVFAPSLTGLGDRSHLLSAGVNLTTHVNDIANLIRWEGLEDVILVGHSYAGFVVSGVAEQVGDKIGSLVFLDAFLPLDGQSVLDALPGSRLNDVIQAAAKKQEIAINPPRSTQFGVNEKDQKWVDDKCTPHPIATFTEKLSLKGARERIARNTYIRATKYISPVFDDAYARASSAGWNVYKVDCGHDVMVDMPNEVLRILAAVP